MKRILKSLAGKCHENQFALQFLAYRDLVIASKKRHLLCRIWNFSFLSENRRFQFLCCFRVKSEIRVSEVLDKPSLGISNSKPLMSVSIGENVSSDIVCGRYLDFFCWLILVCCVIFGIFLNLWLTVNLLKRSILALIQDLSEHSTFQWSERQPGVEKSVEHCTTEALSGIFSLIHFGCNEFWNR